MNEKTIAAIALSNRDFPSFEAKLDEAAKWVGFAAHNGADLIVLPELLNLYRGDGDGNARALRLEDVALNDWRTATARVVEAAVRGNAAVVIPVLTCEAGGPGGPGGLTNSFFLVNKTGDVAGRFQKNTPTPQERAAGVVAGKPTLIEWEGLKVGGAICFDCYYPEVFSAQAALGAELFIVPSLTPAGDYLNFYALHHGVPVVLAYPAWSRIIDMDGREIAGGGYRQETLNFGFGSPVVMATLNFDRVSLYADVNQQKIVEIQRAYGSRVHVVFNQHNVTFYLESRDENLRVSEIIKQFGLIPRRDYFAKHR